MMPLGGEAYSTGTRDFSLTRALALLDGLRGGGARLQQAS
jgi:hypothetical protein